MILKNKYIHVRITEKKKKEIQAIAKKMNTNISVMLTDCINRVIDKNYKLLD